MMMMMSSIARIFDNIDGDVDDVDDDNDHGMMMMMME